jgi:hypothetical protein
LSRNSGFRFSADDDCETSSGPVPSPDMRTQFTRDDASRQSHVCRTFAINLAGTT